MSAGDPRLTPVAFPPIYFVLPGNIWKLGRTPSEAEFQLLSGAGLETESPMAAAGGNPLGASLGMHRVASIDILRKMLLNQHTALTQAQAAATVTAAAEVLGAPAGQAGLVASGTAPVAGAARPATQHPRGTVPCRRGASELPVADASLALALAGGAPFTIPPATNLPDWGKVLAGSRAAEGSAGTSSGGARGQKRKESARVKSKAAAKKAKSPQLTEDDDMSEGSGEEGHNFKNLSVEEQRRQRRCATREAWGRDFASIVALSAAGWSPAASAPELRSGSRRRFCAECSRTASPRVARGGESSSTSTLLRGR